MSEIRITDALQALRPNSEYSVTGNAYSGLNRLDKTQTKPTEEELNTKVTELETAEPFRLLREERNLRLTQTDWTRMDDNGLSISKKTEWKTYRQSLRDLPSSTTPKLDSFGDLDSTSVTWPTKPS